MSRKYFCRLDLENREMLAKLKQPPKAFKAFARPAEVKVDYVKWEDQGNMGSCQGNDLTYVLERLQFVNGHIPVTQLSRIYAYLATQEIDGLLGSDQGSTISGGIELALKTGVCPEALTGYPSRYPNRSERNKILSDNNTEQAKRYRAAGKVAVSDDPEDAKNIIGGGGGISLGFMWPGLPNDRVIRSYRGGSGGHAVAVLGYTQEGLITFMGSWADGPFWATEDGWRQIIRHNWTAAVGLLGSTEPNQHWMNW